MNKHKLLRKFLDGKLSDEEERQALHQFAEDKEMRKRLRIEQNLFNSLNTMLDLGINTANYNYLNQSES